MDALLCKCERHPRVVSVYARSCEYIDGGSASAVILPVASLPAQRVAYDEQFALRDGNDRVLAETYYTVRRPSGELLHGVTDSQGRTTRYETNGVSSIRICLGHKQEV